MRKQSLVLLCCIFAMSLLFTACSSSQGPATNGADSNSYPSRYVSELQGTFGLGTEFNPNTPNIKDVTYTIESMAIEDNRLVLNVSWTPSADGAKPELAEHLTVFDENGHECSRLFTSQNEPDPELNAEKLKAGVSGDFVLRYEYNSDCSEYELSLSDEFNEAMASFVVTVDKTSGEVTQKG